jgi:hypothetical protein
MWHCPVECSGPAHTKACTAAGGNKRPDTTSYVRQEPTRVVGVVYAKGHKKRGGKEPRF